MLALSVVQALASLSYHYGKFIPLLRFTASTFWPALRNPSSNPRSLNHRQLNSVQLWLDYLRFAFGHSDVLSTTLLDLYYNDPIAGPSATLPSKVFYVFSDASSQYLCLFIPRITFCQIAVADFVEAVLLRKGTDSQLYSFRGQPRRRCNFEEQIQQFRSTSAISTIEHPTSILQRLAVLARQRCVSTSSVVTYSTVCSLSLFDKEATNFYYYYLFGWCSTSPYYARYWFDSLV
jgi:hypothetical protein